MVGTYGLASFNYLPCQFSWLQLRQYSKEKNVENLTYKVYSDLF